MIRVDLALPYPRSRWLPVAVGMLVVAAVILVRDWVTLSRFLGQDIRVYQEAGRFVRDGRSVFGPDFTAEGNGLPFTYPPFWALVVAPLSWLPFRVLQGLWVAGSVVALVPLVAISTQSLAGDAPFRAPGRLGLAALATLLCLPLGAVSETLAFGQLGIFLVLACVADAVLVVPRGSRWGGVLVGLATAAKLTPALIVVHWLTTRQWRAAGTAIVTTAACWGVAALVLPGDTVRYFVDGVMAEGTARIGNVERVANQSLFGLLDRVLGAPPPTALYLAVAGVAAVVGLWVAWRVARHGTPLAAVAVVGLTSLLVAPVSWQHHGIWVIPAIGALIGDGRNRRWLFAGLAAFLVMYSPTQGYQVYALVGFTELWNVLYVLLIGALFWTQGRATDGTGDAQERRPDRALTESPRSP